MSRLCLAVAVLLALPMGARAQQAAGPYLGLGAGLDLRSTHAVDLLAHPAVISFSPGDAEVLSAGWAFGGGLRLEVEGQHGSHAVDQVTRSGTVVPSGGRVRRQALMANVVFEAPLPGVAWLRPYAGAGLGRSWSDWRDVRGESLSRDGGRLRLQGEDGTVAWQLMAGVSVPLGSRLSASLGYRYLASGTQRIPLTFTSARGQDTGGSTTMEERHHMILLGLRLSLW